MPLSLLEITKLFWKIWILGGVIIMHEISGIVLDNEERLQAPSFYM